MEEWKWGSVEAKVNWKVSRRYLYQIDKNCDLRYEKCILMRYWQ